MCVVLTRKTSKSNVPTSIYISCNNILELIHGDLCGPITPPTAARNSSKGLKHWLSKRQEFLSRPSELIGGGEFMSQEFQSFCEISGIKRHLTAPYSPQQNGVVERRNRTLLEMTRSILKHMHIPNYLWGEAVRHATYLINRVATRVLVAQTPYKAFKKKKPNVEHLRVFGCISYAKIETQHLKKLDDKSRILVHLGTEPGSKAYRLLDPASRRIIVSRDIVFDESKSWKRSNFEKEVTDEPGMFKLGFGEYGNNGLRETEDRRETEENRERVNEGVNKETDNDEVTVYNGDLLHEEEKDQNQTVLRRSIRARHKPSYLEDYILMVELAIELENEVLQMLINEEPWDFNEAKEEKVWREACKEEISSIVKNKTWDLVDLPAGAKAIGLKWVFKIKRNSDGSLNKHKSRLVAKGYVQKFGVDFEEVFAPVARIKTIRFLIALAASNGWEIHHLDEEEHILLVAVYVDDLLVTGSSLEMIIEFKRGMSANFEMSDLGKLTYYLVIEVYQHEDGITLKQERYARKILEETGMKDCNAVHAPMDLGLKLSKGQGERRIDETEYRRNIGCLRYLLHTRPDLAYCVGVLSRY
ncbi:unnamed protein product [Microthlaspi erraticum]|uniref:Integrase catalytic domain-containing protein n=1 Tax=Microthlaspi erraticum TaxID=1685480 RepID=A0A6D2JCN6_9BRAS|nr:unnamed protein product [Microthlaspi erraticum]